MEETYEEAVAEAAADLILGEEANWRLARRTHERTRTGAGRAPQPGKVTMVQWCGDVRDKSGRRFSVRTGQVYKATWEWRMNSADSAEYPPFMEALAEVSPSTHNAEVVKSRRQEQIEAVVRARAKLPTYEPEDENENPAYTANMREMAWMKATGVKRRPIRADPADDPVGAAYERVTAIADLEKVLREIPRAIGPILDRLRDGAGNVRTGAGGLLGGLYVNDALAKAQTTLEVVAVFLKTGSSAGDVEEFLRKERRGA